MSRITSAAISVAAVVSPILSLAAQQPPAWVDLSVPGVHSTWVTSSDRLTVVRQGNYMRVFSAFTGKWHAWSPSFGTTLQMTDDIVLIPEGDRYTAFSSYRGKFEPVLVNYFNSTLYANDSVVVVVEGNEAHAFSAFTGKWHTHSLPTGWTAAAGPRGAVVFGPLPGGGGASAFDAYGGQWIDLPTQPNVPTAASLAGTCVVVDFGGTLHGFSGLRQAWTDTAPGTGPLYTSTVSTSDMLAIGGHVYSGITGNFLADPFGGSGTMLVQGHVARSTDGSETYVCGITSEKWTLLPGETWLVSSNYTYSASGFRTQTGYAPATMYGVSSDGSVDSVPHTTSFGAQRLAGHMIASRDAATFQGIVYDGLSGQWHTLPADAYVQLPGVWFHSAQVRGISGTYGLSPWTGQFSLLPGIHTALGNGAAASDANDLHVFDPFRERWLSSPWGAARDEQFGRTVGYAIDTTHITGFSPMTGRLERIAKPQPVEYDGAYGDLITVQTADHVLAFSGFGSLVAWTGFPSDQYATVAGTTLTLQCQVPTGSVVLLGLAPQLVGGVPTPFGGLWIDPVQMATALMVPEAGESRAVLPVLIPDVPSLHGSSWFAQTLTLPATGDAYLSEGTPIRIL